MKPVSLRAVSLFSGCGGFCEGIELAGFLVQAAVERDKFAAATYRWNFPSTRLFEGDVNQFLKPQTETSGWAEDLEDIDLVFGGPPCQGFSQIGTRDLSDKRNDLYREFVRVLSVLKPRVFLMENVPNLLLLQKGHYRDLVLHELRNAGYSNAIVLTVGAADFGVPQLRKRAVFVGVRNDLRFPYDLREFLVASLDTHKFRERFTVADAIGDLPEKVVESGGVLPYLRRRPRSKFQRLMRLDCDTRLYSLRRKRAHLPQANTALLYNHHTKEIQARRLALIRHLAPGTKADSLPKRFWDGLRPEKWRRLHPNMPSHTVLAQMHRDLSEFVHPSLDRWITVREAARLQSFHDGFVFLGSEWQQLKQIGNAVPPLLGRALGAMVYDVLNSSSHAKERPVNRIRTEVQAVLQLVGTT